MFIRKDVLKLALPIIVEQTFVMLLGVCNTMMAGNISEEAVSAIGMVDTLNNIFISFFAALSVGATVVVAQRIGKGNIEEGNETAKQALASGLILSLIITLLIWLYRTGLINTFYGSADELVKINAKIYIEFTLLTYPFIAIEQIASGVLRGAGNTKTPMKITIFMNVINIVLGYILIYGIHVFNLNTPSLGIEGAALAIAFARFIGAVIIIGILFKGIGDIKIKRTSSFKINLKTQKEIFNIGIPAGVEQLLFNGGKFIVQVFIVTMGTTAIASNTIGMSVVQIPNVIGNSLTLAATTLVGQYVGRNDIKGAKSTLIYLNNFATVSMVSLGLIFIPLAPYLSSLYTDNIDVINTASMLIRSNAMAMIIWPIAFVLSAGLKGAGDTRYTMVTAVIGMWVFRIGLGYILAIKLNFGVLGIWLGMFSDWFIRGVLYCIRLRGTSWLKHRVA
ncbi:MATE family efflux transporter [Clostridium sp. DSM 8431]|uniref:MATE family efflux transporter n=1 Tax=Clostridium sp. DSM 8431 TaxID=1761781 RepID=UPI000B7E266A|nr:MATE family efflux transporter [Clostridium sp. DSM 8431]